MKISITICLLLFASLLFVNGCKVTNEKSQPIDGEALSKLYCVSCHLYPEPNLLPKRTWNDFVLVRMASYMGIFTDNLRFYDQMPEQWIEPGIGGDRVRNAGVYPDKPVLSLEEWKLIVDFYMTNAPINLTKNPDKLQIQVGVPYFNEDSFHGNREISPLIQGLYWDEVGKALYAGQYQEDIYKYNGSGKQMAKIDYKGYAVDFKRYNNEVYALDMASRMASDNPMGRLLKIDKESNNTQSILQKLMRPVSFEIEDFNRDGEADFLICEYGNNLGALNLYLSSPRGYTKKTIYSDDGSIRTEIMDYNNDGLLDILLLKANADEAIDVYLNSSSGDFAKERLLHFLPTWGSTHFTTVDFQQDGGTDILYSNGDNGDYTPVLKPYHGIHLYSKKDGKYEEEFFIPMNGVYQAEAIDFDQDGDMDIAAVSFHPDFQNDMKESFQIFINDGSNKFESYTIKNYASSRWMRFTCNDIDSDGDTDIVLSAMNIRTPEIAKSISQHWADQDEALILLTNTTK